MHQGTKQIMLEEIFRFVIHTTSVAWEADGVVVGDDRFEAAEPLLVVPRPRPTRPRLLDEDGLLSTRSATRHLDSLLVGAVGARCSCPSTSASMSVMDTGAPRVATPCSRPRRRRPLRGRALLPPARAAGPRVSPARAAGCR
jgi:hypothetical protein